MKLYAFEFRFLGNDLHTVLMKHDVTLEGERGDSEGTWWVPEAASVYFGQSRGPWVSFSDRGTREFWLLPWEVPNILALLWKDHPPILASINDILKWPLFVGETGYGFLSPPKRPHRSFAWRVKGRGF